MENLHVAVTGAVLVLFLLMLGRIGMVRRDPAGLLTLIMTGTAAGSMGLLLRQLAPETGVAKALSIVLTAIAIVFPTIALLIGRNKRDSGDAPAPNLDRFTRAFLKMESAAGKK